MSFNIFNDTLDNCTFTELYNKTTTNNYKNSNEKQENAEQQQTQIIPSINNNNNSEISFDDSIFFTTCDLIKEDSIDSSKFSINDLFKSNSTPLSQNIENSIRNRTIKNDELLLSNWGLPVAILEKYKSKNVTKMFEWQVECLKLPGILTNQQNLIYSAPTSAGKTLVAELLIIKTVLERQKKVIFILPFVSVVREKMFYFQEIFNQCGVRVDGLMGSYHPPGGFNSIQIAICTIEKANSLINKLLQESNLDGIGTIVIDEIHLLGDPSRGYLLELLLTKLRYICKKYKNIRIQIIGMSATLPNLELLAKWLDAELYITNFRPIPLYEQVQINNEIFNNEFEFLRTIQTDFDTDTDNILQLCLETIKESCSVLIFCPTKNWCENLAQQISVAFWKLGSNKNCDVMSRLIRDQLKTDLITELLEQLKYCPVGLDEILKRTISFGVAYHHAGLTIDERDIIENGFRNGAIRVLVATSTLSSGVNLPAKRVLIRTPIFHNKPLDPLVYRQMIGRAGRMGRDTSGESILICQKNEETIAKSLISTQLPPIESCLDGNNGRLERAILEIIASGVASTPEDVQVFTNCTLLAQSVINDNPIGTSLEFLIKNEFVRLQETDDNCIKYTATNLGKACLSSSIPPEDGLALLSELEKARQCFVLDTELHLIYLVTPYTACQQWSNIDWMFYLNLWERLPENMRRVGELIGIKESYIVNATRCKIQTNTTKLYHKYLIHKRFFIALALQDLVNEIPLNIVCNKFNCNRGLLQSLQQTAATFAGMVTMFSHQLGWYNVELLISQFQQRLHFGISRDLLDLMKLPILNNKTARILYNNGLETLIQLANSDIETIENILYRNIPFESNRLRDSETEYQHKQRNKFKNIWIIGREGLTEKQAAEIILNSSRQYLQIELGLKEAKWQITQLTNNNNNNNSNEITSDYSLFENSSILKDVDLNVTNLNSSNDLIQASQEDSIQFEENLKSTLRKRYRLENSGSFTSPRKKLKNNQTRKCLDYEMKIKQFEIIDVCLNEQLFQVFCHEIMQQSTISISLALQKINNTFKTITIPSINNQDLSSFCYKSYKLNGISINWGDNTVYYLNLESGESYLNVIKIILNNPDLIIRIFDCKYQLKQLYRLCGIDFNAKFEDPKLGDWLSIPDGKEKNFPAMVATYSPNYSELLQFLEESPRIRASVEALITFQLVEMVKNELCRKNQDFLRIFDTEMSCLKIITRMELIGIQTDPVQFQNIIEKLQLQINLIEKKAYSLCGRRFNLASTKEIRKLLGCSRKQSLEKNQHPLARLILDWRKFHCILTKTIQPLLRNIDNNRIYGNSIFHTATGRISMHEPNLQNIAKTFEITKNDPINCRQIFQAPSKWIFLSADYCQLELRLLTHFSQDEKLCRIMRQQHGDIFRKIASKWNRIDENLVDDNLRQRTKQLCYAIIYGMSTKTLSEQLDIEESEALKFQTSFQQSYPDIQNYIQQTINNCRTYGYVETITGRRRYLPNINNDNLQLKQQAERQAINTTIQGSAADLVKHTMIKLAEEFERIDRKNRPKLILHLHDELLFEIPENQLVKISKLVKTTMENSVNLSIPFPVKLKSGRTWGELVELQF